MSLAIADRARPWLIRQAPVLLIAILYALAYFKLVHGHGVLWENWSDQSRYLRSAEAFSAARFEAVDHWYPLLYPLLGAPFVAIWPRTPFAVIDGLCFVAAFIGFARVCRHFRVGRWTAFLLFAASTVLYPEIGRRWLEPWTTTPSAALIWLSLGFTLDALVGAIGNRKAAALGLCLVLVPMVRPADAAVAAMLAIIVAMCLGYRRQGPALIVAAAVGVAALAAYLCLHVAIYGLNLSDYDRLSAAFGENFGWLPWKAYLILVDPRPWFPDGEGLLHACPWLLIGAAGLMVACLKPSKERWAAICVALAVSIYLAIMLAYVDLLPSGLWRYNNVHYFKWLLPAFALFSLIFVRDFQRAPVLALTILCGLFLVSCIRLEPVKVGSDHPARELVFSHDGASFTTLYFSRSSISDNQGPQRNIFDYHQMVTGEEHFVAIALKRDFAGREVWLSRDPHEKWPQMGANVYTEISGPDGLASPVLRLAPRLEIGWPSWLRSRGE